MKTRQQVREQLGVVLTDALTGAGNPVQDVYDYLKSTFDGHSPVVCIGSSGTGRNEIEQFGGDWFPVYFYELLVFVARDDDEASAEDVLDQVAQKLFETLETNQYLAGWWDKLDYVSNSEVTPAVVGGDPYWMEAVVVRVEVFE